MQDIQWYKLGASGHFGYPKPEDTYALSTYDDSYCDRCCIGGVQIKPFRLSSEPKSKRSQFLQLNWVFDEFFVRPEVVSTLKKEEITGVSFGTVVRHSTGEELTTIQQLKIDSVLSVLSNTEDFQTVTCKPDNEEGPPWYGGGEPRYAPDYPYCGRVKYHWPGEALRLKSETLESAPGIFKSEEWIGSGGSAYQMIIASEKVVNLIKQQQWRGVDCIPLEVA